MRHVLAMAIGLLVAATPARAQDAGAIEGFGGISVTTAELAAPNVGGTVTIAATPHVHFIGEVGRLGNVVPPIADAIFSFAGTGLRASALYGEGGVRLVAAPGSAVRPYGEATAGIARLDVSVAALGGLAGAAASVAANFLDRSGPMAGVGTGLLLHTGPVMFDVGYRYKQIFAPEPLGSLLGLGQQLRSHQIRIGVGVRF
jgi:opacity protein-like surface antigen